MGSRKEYRRSLSAPQARETDRQEQSSRRKRSRPRSSLKAEPRAPSRARTHSSPAPTMAVSPALCSSVAEHVIIGDPDVFHLAVERRAPDAELARHLRHLSTIVGECEANDLGLDLLQRAHVAA